MQSTFEAIKPHLIGHEGGFSNRPRREDPGGATKYGITIGTLRDWRGGPVTVADVRNLTKDEAFRIYKAQYWDAVRGDRLPAGLDYVVFDFAVNSGPGRAVQHLQRLLQVTVDGIVGVQTLGALQGRALPDLIKRYSAARLAYLKGLKNWRYNKNGWRRRVGEVQALGLDLYRAGRTRTDPLEAVKAVPLPKPAGGKAPASETSAVAAWTSPQGVAQGLGALSGLGAVLSGAGPVQWAFALSLVMAVAVGGYLLLQRERAE